MSSEQLKDISVKSCGVLHTMGHRIQWVHSYVTDNKIYCVYFAENEDAIREHGRLGGFPVTRISEVRQVIDPGTAAG